MLYNFTMKRGRAACTCSRRPAPVASIESNSTPSLIHRNALWDRRTPRYGMSTCRGGTNGPVDSRPIVPAPGGGSDSIRSAAYRTSPSRHRGRGQDPRRLAVFLDGDRTQQVGHHLIVGVDGVRHKIPLSIGGIPRRHPPPRPLHLDIILFRATGATVGCRHPCRCSRSALECAPGSRDLAHQADREGSDEKTG